ncbi:MAG: transposase [Actinobacteria bacterium]|nr:transposase [Actinomycetota bacterium]MCG2819076.1 transposase [Actinomycetes bacterium]MBU4219682.1 transposase [Actinomycetota bacterium]MBU4357709.1 transposase [Actinomycetota bacterium]MBU4391969.1 transposase [Actinomycetota bacterium]
MSEVYVGIDVGSTMCAAAVRNEGGKILKGCKFSTTENNLVEFVSGLEGDVSVLFEEGEMAGWMCRLLLPHADSVEVCDPKRNAWVYKENKADPVDAMKLSEILRLGGYKVVYHTDDEEMATFKIVVQHHQQMVKNTTRIKNQIKSRLRQQGVIITGGVVYTEDGRHEAISRVYNTPVQRIRLQDFRLLDDAERQRDKAERLMVRESGAFPAIARLKKIPGVAIIGASRFFAYVQDSSRFNLSELNKYSRLAVVGSESGDKPLGPEHLNRDGNGTLKDISRKAYNGAMRTKEPNGIKEFHRRSLQRTGDRTNARLNTQRKILAVMLAVMREGGKYSDDRVNG